MGVFVAETSFPGDGDWPIVLDSLNEAAIDEEFRGAV